jgi:hypothetical protein
MTTSPEITSALAIAKEELNEKLPRTLFGVGITCVTILKPMIGEGIILFLLMGIFFYLAIFYHTGKPYFKILGDYHSIPMHFGSPKTRIDNFMNTAKNNPIYLTSMFGFIIYMFYGTGI